MTVELFAYEHGIEHEPRLVASHTGDPESVIPFMARNCAHATETYWIVALRIITLRSVHDSRFRTLSWTLFQRSQTTEADAILWLQRISAAAEPPLP